MCHLPWLTPTLPLERSLPTTTEPPTSPGPPLQPSMVSPSRYHTSSPGGYAPLPSGPQLTQAWRGAETRQVPGHGAGLPCKGSGGDSSEWLAGQCEGAWGWPPPRKPSPDAVARPVGTSLCEGCLVPPLIAVAGGRGKEPSSRPFLYSHFQQNGLQGLRPRCCCLYYSVLFSREISE